jgi:acyl-CoA thioester hydrolase
MIKEIPEGAASTKYRVPYADTDMMGIVYYGNYLTLFERCRNEVMRQTGVTYKEMEERDKAMLPVIEAHVDYSKPARYDDELTIYGWLAAAGGVRIKVCCVVMRGDELLASGYTVHACVSTENMRPMRLPSYIVEHIVAE